MLRVVTDAERRAAAGAAYLDQQYPDWAARISLPTLDIARGQHCVIGQLFGSWGNHRAPSQHLSRPTLESMGFLCTAADDLITPDHALTLEQTMVAENRRLTAAWRVEIENRRAA